MAGPDGVLHPGDVLDLPIAEADRLIAACAAVEVVRPAGKGCAKKHPTSRSPFTPAAISDEELEHGVTLDRWAMTRCPDAFALACRGRGVLVLGEDASNDPERERYWAAVRELRGALQADLDAGLYDLGVPPETATGAAKAISLDALPDVLGHIAWHYKTPCGYYGSDLVNLRLYQPGRFTAATQDAAPKASVTQAASDSTAPSTPAEAEQSASVERAEKETARKPKGRPTSERQKRVAKLADWLRANADREGGPAMTQAQYLQLARKGNPNLPARELDNARRMISMGTKLVSGDSRWRKTGPRPKKPKT